MPLPPAEFSSCCEASVADERYTGEADQLVTQGVRSQKQKNSFTSESAIGELLFCKKEKTLSGTTTREGGGKKKEREGARSTRRGAERGGGSECKKRVG